MEVVEDMQDKVNRLSVVSQDRKRKRIEHCSRTRSGAQFYSIVARGQ